MCKISVRNTFGRSNLSKVYNSYHMLVLSLLMRENNKTKMIKEIKLMKNASIDIVDIQ